MSRSLLLIMAGLMLAASGCFHSSSPSRTFVLSKVSLPAAETALQLRIGRIVLPDYLKRWEMVTLVNEREIRINDFAQWGELLEDSVRRTMTENFRQVLGPEQITDGNSDVGEGAWRLDYEFLSLTGNEAGFFQVKVRCRARSGQQVRFFSIAFELPCTPGKPEKLVKAHEEALGKLVLETVLQLQAQGAGSAGEEHLSGVVNREPGQ